jgi:hypothetical protein
MGHTPDFEKIVSRCGGKIIIIDTGWSRIFRLAREANKLQVYHMRTAGHSPLFLSRTRSHP